MDHSSFHGVEEFMKNNEEIPEALAQDLRRILSKPLQELHDLDVELKELDERRAQIEIKRAQVQEYIAQFDCVLSPIRRLSADILHNIFYHCLPTHRDPIMSAVEAPLLLTRICRAWRHIAHASPRLWARLYITFSDEDVNDRHSPEFEPPSCPTKQDISNFLQLRCNAVEEWLSRSGACPLSISIYYTNYTYTSHTWGSNSDQQEIPSDITSKLLHVLARHSNRWQNLELRIPIHVYQKLEALVLPSQVPLLNSLKASFRGIYRSSPHEKEGTILEARNLTNLSLSSSSDVHGFGNFFGTSLGVTSTNANLSNITKFYYHGALRIAEAKSLLRNCPNVEHLNITLHSDPPRNWNFTDVPKTPISLPHLYALGIIDATYADHAVDIYECIDAPRLEWLDYTKQAMDIATVLIVNHVNPNNTDPPITVLLRKSHNLKKLIIMANDSTTTELREILKSAQGIIHLSLGSGTRKVHSLETYFGDTQWNLGDLFLEDDKGKGRESDPEPTLLPHLEVLEVFRGTCTTNDQILLDMILRLMNWNLDPTFYNINGSTRLLKKVTISFERPTKMDLWKRLSELLEQTKQGIELKLFESPNQTLPPVNSLSPRYAVHRLTDCTWDYGSIEEEFGK